MRLLQKLVIRAHSWEGDEGLDQLSLANLPSLARMEASPEALELLPPLPGLTRITLAGNTSELEQAHLDVLAALPRLACLNVSWGFRLLSSTATEEQEAVAALRQQLPHLTIEGDS